MVENSNSPAVRDAQGRFPRGVSGNPGGRVKADSRVRALAREHTEEAIAALAEALYATKVVGLAAIEVPDYDIRVRAADALLDRAWGRPSQAIHIEQQEAQKLEQMTDNELMAIATGAAVEMSTRAPDVKS